MSKRQIPCLFEDEEMVEITELRALADQLKPPGALRPALATIIREAVVIGLPAVRQRLESEQRILAGGS